jgi:putative hemolysin
MAAVWIEIAVILALVLANGLFSMAEIALISSRKGRLRARAAGGDAGAIAALELAQEPNRFLPTVQIGITLVGTLASAISGATLAAELDTWLERFPRLEPYSEVLAVTVVVLALSFVTLVLGELVPKRIGMSRPEVIAGRVARGLSLLSRTFVPLVKLLGWSTEGVVRLLGIRPSGEPPVTEEEVEALIQQGAEAGVFDPSEHQLVRRVFRLGDRTAGQLMTPRPELVWIDVADAPAEIRRKIAASPHSRFPVCAGSLDDVLGIVQVKDLLVQGFRGQPFDLRGILIMPLFLYEKTPGFKVLELFKTSGIHIGIVLDEYGVVKGIITLNDVFEALVGGLPEEGEAEPSSAVQRDDGSWLVDGRMLLHDVAEHLELPAFPEADYHTLAGFVIDRIGRIPRVADRFTWGGRIYEVVDMDGHRIDKVLIRRAEASSNSGTSSSRSY